MVPEFHRSKQRKSLGFQCRMEPPLPGVIIQLPASTALRGRFFQPKHTLPTGAKFFLRCPCKDV